METVQELVQKVNMPTFNFTVGNLLFAPNYAQAAAVVFLLFLLVLTLARLRRMYVDWSLKGAFIMMFLGFFLALVLEGFLVLGGRTALTELLGWKNAPKPIGDALDVGRGQLVEVLGVTEEIPTTRAMSVEDVLDDLQSLPQEDIDKIKALMCNP